MEKFFLKPMKRCWFEYMTITGRCYLTLMLCQNGQSGKKGNYRRQIFLIKLGGFDTHANQLIDPALLRELSYVYIILISIGRTGIV